ncbi:hypothetical protein QN400_06410 [Pseudomonas sp. RTC3]|uniref:hypothetical protein n=1 Tax=unclassified Pseudomonas TaxID=196821 RepID=UPI002AB4DA5E|nr:MULTISPECIES: hypothetical protein [unclassified Pseudomonas]MEB0061653.1 hypothetical protein [Pseudomonas sp. RTC3]MDY7565182.1 hypothetical protein [Pseudomonas sp. 5C2]MEB0008506.1 hypothetical protein [Pseudomonas sp. RTB2]MEB0017015.1 hypothetical protein [Pseudomonas sp. RTB3]MEB0028289.1 hypothetical protein [Pseudomonas sp. MH9.2]
MPEKTASSVPSEQPQSALSKWDDEDAAGSRHVEAFDRTPELSNAELVHLRVRVIALENLVIALLAQGPDQQLAVAREMASYISPRPGFTQHPLTVHAASHMFDSVDRAVRFRKLSAL